MPSEVTWLCESTTSHATTIMWCRHAAPRASEISTRGTRILLVPTDHYNSQHYHRHTAPIFLLTFLFPAPNFTLFSRKLHTLSCRRTLRFSRSWLRARARRNGKSKHWPPGTSNVHRLCTANSALLNPDMKSSLLLDIWAHTLTIKTPSHIASCCTTETAGSATFQWRTDLHNTELLINCAVISLLPVVYYAVFICAIVFKDHVCLPSHVYYGIYGIIHIKKIQFKYLFFPNFRLSSGRSNEHGMWFL
jgi:hypothetical protein